MRYSDGPTVRTDLLIEASVGRVWALVSDVGVPALFSTELQEGRWLDVDHQPAAGSCFVGRNHHPAAGEWETTCVVTVWEPERAFAWAVGDPEHPSASWGFELEHEGPAVRLHQWARLGPAPSGLTPAIVAMPEKEERIIARRLEEHRANMQRTLEGIKALAESEP